MTETAEICERELPVGTELLRGQYRIERFLIHGGFGVTYIARDSLDRRVAIKECYPSDLCCRTRDGVQVKDAENKDKFDAILRHFQQEARRLAGLEHPNIVRVHQVFAENGTAYFAMDFIDGVDLHTIVELEPERLERQLLENALCTALNAVRYVHDEGILHCDISPDNFLLDADDNLTLIDFGAAYEHCGAPQSRGAKILAVKDGYSPHEVYDTDGYQDESSDLYALGATFYHLITGEMPPTGQDRFERLANDGIDPYIPLVQGNWDHDIHFLASIDRALAVHQRDRLQSASEWLGLLDGKKVEPVATKEAKTEPHPEQDGEIDLTGVVSQLVKDTNLNLSRGLPHALRSNLTENSNDGINPRGEEEKKQLFDLFGNPIEDVDAFLKEQDRLAKKQKKKAMKEGENGHVTNSKNSTNGGSTLGRIISRVFTGKRTADAPMLQN